MYDIISDIISHEWITNYSGEQQYIYYICSAIIVLFFVIMIDLFYRLISAVIGKLR